MGLVCAKADHGMPVPLVLAQVHRQIRYRRAQSGVGHSGDVLSNEKSSTEEGIVSKRRQMMYTFSEKEKSLIDRLIKNVIDKNIPCRTPAFASCYN